MRCLIWVVLATVLATSDGQSVTGDQSTYVLAFPRVDSDGDDVDPELFISITNPGPSTAAVRIRLPGDDDERKPWEVRWDLSSGSTGVLDSSRLPPWLQAVGDPSLVRIADLSVGIYDTKRIWITSTEPLAISAGSARGDAFYVLPSSSLGLRYYVISGQGSCEEDEDERRRNQIVVVNGGEYDSNQVIVTLVETDERGGGRGRIRRTEVPVVLSSKRVNTWIYESDADLTGSIVESQYPVGVIVGRVDGFIGFEVEMLPPVSNWGLVYPIPYQQRFVAPSRNYTVYRVLASVDRTEYSLDGDRQTARLMTGEYVDLKLDGPRVLTCSEPCLVVQLRGYSIDCLERAPRTDEESSEESSEASSVAVGRMLTRPVEPPSPSTPPAPTIPTGSGLPNPNSMARDESEPSGFFTLIPPLEQYKSDAIFVAVPPGVNFEHYLAVISSMPPSHKEDDATCSIVNETVALRAFDSDHFVENIQRYYRMNQEETISCEAADGFAAVSYGIGRGGSRPSDYAFANCQWAPPSALSPTVATRSTTSGSKTPTGGPWSTSSASDASPSSHQSTSSTTSVTPNTVDAHTVSLITAKFNTSNLTERLEFIQTMSQDPKSAGMALEMMSSTLTPNTSMSESDIALSAAALSKCAKVRGLSDQSFYQYVSCIDTLLDQDLTALVRSNSTEELLRSMPILASNILSPNAVAEGRNLAVSIREAPCVRGEGLIQLKNGTILVIDEWPTDRIVEPDQVQILIYLPLDENCNDDVRRRKREAGAGAPMTKTSFIVYRNTKFFTPRGSAADPSVAGEDTDDACGVKQIPQTTFVVSADILSGMNGLAEKGRSLRKPVTIGFAVEDRSKPGAALLHARSLCGFWAYGPSRWSSDGCRLIKTVGGLRICQCDHLTDFTLLVDTSSNDPALCDRTITILTRLLTLASVLSLVLALLMHFVCKYSKYVFDAYKPGGGCLRTLVRSQPPRQNKSSLSEPLMATMLLFLVLFNFLSNQKRAHLDEFECKISAAILYSILLSQMCWAALAGLSFFKTYYVVFDQRILRALTKRAFGVVACLVIPFMATVILWTARDDFFDRQDFFCWVRPDYIWIAVMLPVSVLVVGDLGLTVLLIKSFFCSKSAGASKGNRRSRITLLAQKCVVLFTVQIVLAFPWVFQYFTIGSPETTVFHYLFSLAYGSQGAIFAWLYIVAYVRWIRRTRTSPNSSSRVHQSTITTANQMSSTKWSQRLRKVSPWSTSSSATIGRTEF